MVSTSSQVQPPSPVVVDVNVDVNVDHVAVIDMSLPQDQLGTAVHEACTTVGFFHVVNHGVSEDLRSRVLELSRTF